MTTLTDQEYMRGIQEKVALIKVFIREGNLLTLDHSDKSDLN